MRKRKRKPMKASTRKKISRALSKGGSVAKKVAGSRKARMTAAGLAGGGLYLAANRKRIRESDIKVDNMVSAYKQQGVTNAKAKLAQNLKKAKKMGMSGDQAYKYVEQANREVRDNYNKMERQGLGIKAAGRSVAATTGGILGVKAYQVGSDIKRSRSKKRRRRK